MNTDLDDSIEAIRRRATESQTWPNAELAAATGRSSQVDQERSNALWRAVQDRRILLELLEEAIQRG